jgi:hypothetical protein
MGCCSSKDDTDNQESLKPLIRSESADEDFFSSNQGFECEKTNTYFPIWMKGSECYNCSESFTYTNRFLFLL